MGQLFPVTCRLIEHDHKLRVAEQGAGLNRIKQILHVLRDGGGVGIAFTELTPRGIEKGRGKLVFKHDMELVDKDVRTLAPFPIEGNTVEHSVGDDQMADGL